MRYMCRDDNGPIKIGTSSLFFALFNRGVDEEFQYKELFPRAPTHLILLFSFIIKDIFLYPYFYQTPA